MKKQKHQLEQQSTITKQQTQKSEVIAPTAWIRTHAPTAWIRTHGYALTAWIRTHGKIQGHRSNCVDTHHTWDTL